MSYPPNFNGLGGFKKNGQANGYANGYTNGQVNGHAPDHPDGSLAESATDLTSLYNKFERYQQHDLERTEFMNVREPYPSYWTSHWCSQNLFARVEFLTQETETIKAERNREKDFMSACQLEKQRFNEFVKHVQRAVVSISSASKATRGQPFLVIFADSDRLIIHLLWSW
jgi:flagellar biosynthesis/type III secretory pathway chaperone